MVSRVVLLDAGILGLVTNPKRSQQSTDCARWLQNLAIQDNRIIVPEIADYEVRRELLRAVLSRIITEYEKLGDLTTAAFVTTRNVSLRLQASIELAQIYGVAKADIIHNTDELDAFMLS